MLDATIAELVENGYAALRVDDVARASGVNKTTIYRRWPTKADLVLAALVASRDRDTRPRDTGDRARLGPLEGRQGFVKAATPLMRPVVVPT